MYAAFEDPTPASPTPFNISKPFLTPHSQRCVAGSKSARPVKPKEALKQANAACKEDKSKKRATQTDSTPNAPKKQTYTKLPDGSKLYINMHLSSDSPTKPTLTNVHLWCPRARIRPFDYGGDYFGWVQRDTQCHLPILLVCPQDTMFNVLGMSNSKEDAERDFEQQIEKQWEPKLQGWREKAGMVQAELRVVVNQMGSKVVTWNISDIPVMWFFFDILEVSVVYRAEVKNT